MCAGECGGTSHGCKREGCGFARRVLFLGSLFFIPFAMRSLPQPRTTLSRRAKRLYRAIIDLLLRGTINDPGAFVPHPNTSASTVIKQAWLTRRLRTAHRAGMLHQGVRSAFKWPIHRSRVKVTLGFW